MDKADLLRRAKNDLWTANLILAQELTDEFQLDVAAYHVQQTVEKLMKYEMNEAGIRFMHVHEADLLFEQMQAEGLSPPAWIMEYSETLNNYATKTRYGTNLVTAKQKLLLLKTEAAAYFEHLAGNSTTEENYPS
jgi:HEPN domain-containing protein